MYCTMNVSTVWLATFKISHELNGTRYECVDFKQQGVQAQILFQKTPSGNNGREGRLEYVKNQGQGACQKQKVMMFQNKEQQVEGQML